MPPCDQATTRWFREQILPHEEMLRAWLRARFGSQLDLDDILQEAYVRVCRARTSDVPYGVRLSIQKAKRSDPVMLHDRPWEGSYLNYANVLFEEGRYRMWYRVLGASPQGYVC